jgi:hypothetical protein
LYIVAFIIQCTHRATWFNDSGLTAALLISDSLEAMTEPTATLCFMSAISEREWEGKVANEAAASCDTTKAGASSNLLLLSDSPFVSSLTRCKMKGVTSRPATPFFLQSYDCMLALEEEMDDDDTSKLSYFASSKA